MTAQTSIQRPAAAKPPPYPAYNICADGVDHPDFWLAAWLRKAAQIEALVAFRKANQRKLLLAKTPNLALIDALWYAEPLMRWDARTAMDYVVREGKLLFAWAGTTRLQVAP